MSQINAWKKWVRGCHLSLWAASTLSELYLSQEEKNTFHLRLHYCKIQCTVSERMSVSWILKSVRHKEPVLCAVGVQMIWPQSLYKCRVNNSLLNCCNTQRLKTGILKLWLTRRSRVSEWVNEQVNEVTWGLDRWIFCKWLTDKPAEVIFSVGFCFWNQSSELQGSPIVTFL